MSIMHVIATKVPAQAKLAQDFFYHAVQQGQDNLLRETCRDSKSRSSSFGWIRISTATAFLNEFTTI